MALGLITGLAAGCSTTARIETVPALAPTAPLPAELRILLLDPLVTFEDAASQAALVRPREVVELGRRQTAAAQDAFSNRARLSMSADLPAGNGLHQAAYRSSSEAEQLLRAYPSAEAVARLRELATLAGCDAVLVLRCRVKLGPDGSWDPWSGAITAAQNSAQLRAALLAPATGAVLWRSDVLLRDLPRGDRLDAALRSLFASLPFTSSVQHP